MKNTLTHKQSELFEFIRNYANENEGVFPSFQEMKDALGFASLSEACRKAKVLEARGYISLRLIPDSSLKSLKECSLGELLDELQIMSKVVRREA